ncbi:MAG: hypothetical protein EPN50_02410 [Chloroflexota bacterium]|nr:MAG: hypothetical protein EPN50_02410 [Chloroflexota bacterium]
MFETGRSLREHHLTLFTDSYVIRGTVTGRAQRLSDVLNHAEDGLLVLDDASFEEFGSHTGVDQAPFAQVNLASVLFAVSDEPIEPMPEMRLPKVAQQALVSIPPFRAVGQVHLAAVESLREALTELHQAFVPLSQATYWSEALREPRTTALILAFNHARAQILAPYAERDPWADARAASLQERGAPGTEVP